MLFVIGLKFDADTLSYASGDAPVYVPLICATYAWSALMFSECISRYGSELEPRLAPCDVAGCKLELSAICVPVCSFSSVLTSMCCVTTSPLNVCIRLPVIFVVPSQVVSLTLNSAVPASMKECVAPGSPVSVVFL